MSRRPADYASEAKNLLACCIDALELEGIFLPSVKRGIPYYVNDGFEVRSAQSPALRSRWQAAELTQKELAGPSALTVWSCPWVKALKNRRRVSSFAND